MREGTKVGRTVAGVKSIEGQLVNSREPDITSDSFTYVFMRCLSLQRRKQFTRVFGTVQSSRNKPA